MNVQSKLTTINRRIFLIADDHPLFRDALRQALESQMGETKFIMAGNFAEVGEMISKNRDADLLLLDLKMPGVSGFVGLMRLRSEYPALPIIMVSASDDASTIKKTLDLGAMGFIPKSSSNEQICEAINTVLAGDIWLPPNVNIDEDMVDEFSDILKQVATLTPQQHRVLGMINDGLLNKQIAYQLSVSEATIKAHVSAVLSKLNVDSRTQAVIQLAKISDITSAS